MSLKHVKMVIIKTKTKYQKMTSTGNAEKLEEILVYYCWKCKMFSHYAKNTEAAQTLKTEITYDPARPFLGINPEEHTCKSIDRGTDKEDVVPIYNGIFVVV